ncbi:MAG: LysE family transporter [Thermodesulfovibrionales bacterium]
MTVFLIAASSFVIALSGALVPGPLFTVTVSESFRRGFHAGPLVIIGHGLLELAVVLLIVLQVTPLLRADDIRTAVSAAGGLVLVLMGGVTLRDARTAHIDISRKGAAGGMHPVLAGLLGSLSNPYWVVWWLTIGIGYLLSAMKFGAAGVIAFFAGHISADLLWYSVVSYAVSRGREIMGDRSYRGVLAACGVVLTAFGLWFLSVAFG